MATKTYTVKFVGTVAPKNKALVTLAEQTKSLKDDYTKIVNDWAINARNNGRCSIFQQRLRMRG